MFKQIALAAVCLATLSAGTIATPDTAEAWRGRRPYYRTFYGPPARSYYYGRPYRAYYGYGPRYYEPRYYGPSRYYDGPGYYYGGPRYYGGRRGVSFWFGF